MTTPTDPPAFVATPVPHTAAELEAVTYNADGLVGAIVQDASDGAVLMFAWMNAESLAKHPRDRPHLVLEPEPSGVLVQGRDLGRPAVRPQRRATTATVTRCW